MAITIGAALRAMREALGLSQSGAVAAAHRAGYTGKLSADLLSKFEREERDPPFDGICEFVKLAYGADVHFMYNGKIIDELLKQFS